MTLRSYFPKRLGQVALVDPPPVLFEAVRLPRPTRPFPRLQASMAYELRETRLSVRHRRDA